MKGKQNNVSQQKTNLEATYELFGKVREASKAEKDALIFYYANVTKPCIINAYNFWRNINEKT